MHGLGRRVHASRCPRCDAGNAPDARACERCGAALERRCTRCRTNVPGWFRFCGACGAALTATPARRLRVPDAPRPRERRPLTVLFCDLAGSTSLSTRLDAEDFADLIGRYFVLCKAIFERHGGYVDREEGDCLRVYFGYPQAHDDDASNAARASLETVAAVRQLGRELGARAAGGLEVHIGIHTGEVVAGELDGHDVRQIPLVAGDVPNVAKRLEEQAAAGTVLLSAATHRLLRGGFVVEATGPLALKGVQQPVQAYRLSGHGRTGAIEAFGARELGPLLGREQELAALGRCLAEADAGRGQAIVLGGEAGIGKSRLVHAFVASLAGERRLHVLQCEEQFSNTAFHPVVELLQEVLQLAHDDPAARREALLAEAFRSGALPDAAALPHVASLLGVALGVALGGTAPVVTARLQRERMLEWLSGWLLGGGTAERAAILVVEDVHWADASTLEFLASAIARIADRPVLLLITCRREFTPPWPPQPHVTPLALNRLAAAEAALLVRNIARHVAPPPAVLAQIAARSDGVPLYVEELTSMLLETGAFADAGDALPNALAIPQTLRGSLMARLDHLRSAKPTAQVAAVLGREFSYRLVRLVSGLDDAALQAALSELIGAELLFQRSLQPELTYAFKHALIQEAAYLSLLRTRRTELHDRTARVLTDHFGEIAASQPEILAHHCASAGRSAEAVDHWHRAGTRALETSADVEAVGHLRRALRQLDAEPAGPERAAREVKCLITLGSALADMRGYAQPEVEETFGRVHKLCENMGDSDELYSTLTGLHAFYHVRGHLLRAIDTGRLLVRSAEAGGDALRRAQAHRCLGWSLFSVGQLEAGDRHLETALGLFDRMRAGEHSRLHGMHPWVAGFANRALLLWFAGKPDLALAHCEQACGLARELRQPLALAYALSVSAAVHVCRGEPEATLGLVREVTDLASDDRMPYWGAWTASLGAWALAGTGRRAEGLVALEAAIERYRATGAQLFEPWSLGLLADVLIAADEPQRALAAVDAALAVPLVADGYFYGAELYRLKGELLRAAGDNDAGTAWLARALALARSQGARALEQRLIGAPVAC